uniref:RagB/SusD family nutrient uptake outer membrane protein n=1 Tax=Pedobacter schmidteae TaxID=2201271 RepID=UPI000EB08E54|nr:RagB/SusD family nutrient uptake outer membrane protein [Pedobacter schmidteae]
MKLSKLLYTLAVPVLLTASCTKFLDVKPKGVIIAENIGDYESLLNSGDIVNPFGSNNPIIYPTDDLKDITFNLQSQSSPRGSLYFWMEYINNSSVRPDMWVDLYRQIANLNVITEGVLSAKDGTEGQRKQLYAEAMVAKAFNYFHLLSVFSPAYGKTTAAADYGVPYVTSTDVSMATPPRPSLEASYQQLISDINAAIPDLPENNINNTRVTKYAAYGMLTRIYMSMADYINAAKYADMVLNSGQANILNYSAYLGSSLPQTTSNPEELWVRYSNNTLFNYSEDLLSKYELNSDLRIRLLSRVESGVRKFGGSFIYNPNRGITYAEIYLDKAECLARAGNISDALDIVNNKIRKNRFETAKYTALSAGNTEAAITAVLAERRRELAFKGLRWIDMKRLDKDGRMEAVKRIAADGTTVLATLAPGSTAYTFQIPLMVQSFNANMPLNKR